MKTAPSGALPVGWVAAMPNLLTGFLIIPALWFSSTVHVAHKFPALLWTLCVILCVELSLFFVSYSLRIVFFRAVQPEIGI